MEGGQRGGRKEEGITLAGSGSWIPAKIKREREKKKKNPSITFKRYKSKRAQRETERQQRTTALGEDRKGRGV